MKLIVSGATGFLGREVVRQSLAVPAVTCVVALALLVVATVADYGECPPDVTAQFAGAITKVSHTK
ncbi:uncharacterized protein B0I36DRAFT_366276 [Microdochium trichocladiopsis]|uniref:Uncharacterized protein n=1 Tax=Microdochium trichocladiopsis TaxID=1682393 RepID=A0A9P9BP97_9PEZI|nr:uncharacterized protein B0I36DRAFT_366276 [Microdochium trichocladiopsis]KAH7024326.1 hypothetical protein B0I36DRAFT_366276 [Microdochium trichocladiopsis]